MFCFRCLGTIPNVSRHVTQRIQPQTVKAVSGIPSRTNPQSTTTTLRQSSRLLTTTTAGTTFPSQLTRFSSSPFSILRTTSSAFPSSSLSSSLSSPATSLPSSTRSFSATPYLGVKRDTYNPSRRVQKRRHGFLARLKTRAGRKILKRRQVKGRKNMSW